MQVGAIALENNSVLSFKFNFCIAYEPIFPSLGIYSAETFKYVSGRRKRIFIAALVRTT